MSKPTVFAGNPNSQYDAGLIAKEVHDYFGQAIRTVDTLSLITGYFTHFSTTYNVDNNPTKIVYHRGETGTRTDITLVSDVAGSLNNKFFFIYSAPDNKKHHVWYNVNGAGINPAPFGSTPIEVTIATNENALVVCFATNLTINNMLSKSFTSSRNSATLEIRTSGLGVTNSSLDFNTGFAISSVNGTQAEVSNVNIAYLGNDPYFKGDLLLGYHYDIYSGKFIKTVVLSPKTSGVYIANQTGDKLVIKPDGSINTNVSGKDKTGATTPLLTDTEGRLITQALSGYGADFAFGEVNTASVAKVLANKTVYTEQTVNSRCSIISSNIADSPLSGIPRNTATTANDLSLIYSEVKALAATAVHSSIFGSGETLTPNVYDIASAGSLTASLTLNGGGNPNALFVFKFTGAFSVGALSSITLTNGATPNNVYFISEAATSISTSCTLSGIFISKVGAISVGAGCNITGRIATLSGGITTDQDNITSPTTASMINLRTLITYSIFTSLGSITNTQGAISSTITGDIGTNGGTITGYGTGNSMVFGGLYTPDTQNTTGTGALKIKITYLDQFGNGPFYEIVTMAEMAYVNTVSTTICFIERMEVFTVGSTGSNAGIITLKSSINGGGVTIGTIGVNDNRTLWTHHYVPVNKICHITGTSCGHNGTAAGSGAVFTLAAKSIGVTDAAEIQISDFVRLYGQSSTIVRNYSSPLKVVGPARVRASVTPEAVTAATYRSSFDFFEP